MVSKERISIAKTDDCVGDSLSDAVLGCVIFSSFTSRKVKGNQFEASVPCKHTMSLAEDYLDVFIIQFARPLKCGSTFVGQVDLCKLMWNRVTVAIVDVLISKIAELSTQSIQPPAQKDLLVLLKIEQCNLLCKGKYILAIAILF